MYEIITIIFINSNDGCNEKHLLKYNFKVY